jgi:hypothetical protein
MSSPGYVLTQVKPPGKLGAGNQLKGRHMELDITALLAVSDDESPDLNKLMEAIEAASSQDRTVWLTERGQRVAALPAFIRPPVQFPDVTVQLTGQPGNTGYIMGAVTGAMKEAGYSERDLRNVREAIMGCASYVDVLVFVAHTVNVK